MIWLVVLASLPLIYLLYNRWSWIHSYWEFRGVPGPTPLPFIGNMLQNIVGRKTLGELGLEWSRQYANTPLIGFYSFMKPFVLVNSLDYVVTVLIDEFSHFTDRVVPRTSKTVSEQLLSTTSGSTWKTLRTKTAPIFVSEKRKGMLNRFAACCEKATAFVDENCSRDVAASEFIKPYAIQVSARIVFGLETENLSEFTTQYEKASESSGTKRLHKLIYYSLPRLAEFMKISSVPHEQNAYFKKTLLESLNRRKSSGEKVEDIAQQLLELKEKGNVHVDTWQPEDKYLCTDALNSSKTFDMTDELLASQAIDFLITGVETVFTTLTFTLLELSRNQQVMDKLVQEITGVLDRHKHFSYQALEDMKYLDMCIMEAMRLHPAVPALTRCCTKNYTFDNGLQVEKGMMMCVPVQAIHSLAEVYPEPEVFRPERFVVDPPLGAYIPFGDGPRMCIGKDLGLLETKALLCRLVSRYDVKVSKKTRLPVSLSPNTVVASPRSPVFFRFVPRSQ